MKNIEDLRMDIRYNVHGKYYLFSNGSTQLVYLHDLENLYFALTKKELDSL